MFSYNYFQIFYENQKKYNNYEIFKKIKIKNLKKIFDASEKISPPPIFIGKRTTLKNNNMVTKPIQKQ
jgi:hypothetical protein